MSQKPAQPLTLPALAVSNHLQWHEKYSDAVLDAIKQDSFIFSFPPIDPTLWLSLRQSRCLRLWLASQGRHYCFSSLQKRLKRTVVQDLPKRFDGVSNQIQTTIFSAKAVSAIMATIPLDEIPTRIPASEADQVNIFFLLSMVVAISWGDGYFHKWLSTSLEPLVLAALSISGIEDYVEKSNNNKKSAGSKGGPNSLTAEEDLLDRLRASGALKVQCIELIQLHEEMKKRIETALANCSHDAHDSPSCVDCQIQAKLEGEGGRGDEQIGGTGGLGRVLKKGIRGLKRGLDNLRSWIPASQQMPQTPHSTSSQRSPPRKRQRRQPEITSAPFRFNSPRSSPIIDEKSSTMPAAADTSSKTPIPSTSDVPQTPPGASDISIGLDADTLVKIET